MSKRRKEKRFSSIRSCCVRVSNINRNQLVRGARFFSFAKYSMVVASSSNKRKRENMDETEVASNGKERMNESCNRKVAKSVMNSCENSLRHTTRVSLTLTQSDVDDRDGAIDISWGHKAKVKRNVIAKSERGRAKSNGKKVDKKEQWIVACINSDRMYITYRHTKHDEKV